MNESEEGILKKKFHREGMPKKPNRRRHPEDGIPKKASQKMRPEESI